MVGCGGMARYHISAMLKQRDTTQIVAACEPSPNAWAAAEKIFEDAGVEPPPNEPNLDRLLASYGDQLDAAFIITPHVFHHDQAKACMEAGLDVLLEKPMVMNTDEAFSLIDTRDQTGRLLVVAFNGSLSPAIRRAAAMLRAGELGEMLSISATVWQSWGKFCAGTWRQQPELSGGGFMFDTGAHMLNTVVDLAGEEFAEVSAWLDNHGAPVDLIGVVIGKLKSGAMVTMHGCGATIRTCTSDVRVCGAKGILQTGVWGERLNLQRDGEPELTPVELPPSLGVWEQFLAVRAGRLQNPCPPEVGLRMARLWDAIRESAAKNGAPVRCAS
jgi:predicted dehydrogenase